MFISRLRLHQALIDLALTKEQQEVPVPETRKPNG
jgi:hypothetical protein